MHKATGDAVVRPLTCALSPPSPATRFLSYVAARIPTWTNEGEERIRNLYARIGMPFRECQQPFYSLDEERRDIAMADLMDKGPLYGLKDITIPSFVFRKGYQQPVSGPRRRNQTPFL